MINRAFEWFASRYNPRFKLYRQARLAYESCMPEIGKPFEDLEPGDYEKWRCDARLVAAAENYRAAIELCRQENALGDLATALYQLGMLFHLQGRLDDANECIQASLQQQDGFPQSNRELQTLGSGCLYHLGVMALKRGHFAAARQHLRTSLKIDEALDDFRGALSSRRALEKCELLCPSGESATDDAAPAEPTEDSPAAVPKSPPHGSGDGTSFHPQPPQSPRQSEPPRRARRPRRPSFDEDAVWLLSNSIAANDSVMELLEQFQNDFPRRTAFSRVAFGSGDPNRTAPDPIAPGSRLCAAVLVVEPGALDNEEFRHWARWCITAVADRDDFRLFVWLHEMTMEELIRMANRRHHPNNAQGASDATAALADELINTVQISEGASAAAMVDALISYLFDRDDIRAAAHWRKTKLAASAFLARAAQAIEVVCGVALVAGAVAWLGVERFKWDAGWRLLGHFEPGALALVFGVPMFALLTIPLFFLSKGTAASQAILREDPRLVWWFCGGALLCPATVVIPTRLDASAPMVALGIMMGVLLDVLRRNGLQARRARVSLERVYDSVGRDGSELLARALVGPQPLHPLTCPLFPAESPSAFISYRRHSDWSAAVAGWLHSELRKNNIPSSLDRESIGEGSSWRRALNRFISETQVFLVLVDERSLTSRWMAAETITALAGRRLTKQPEIVVLVEPSLSASPRHGGWAVFHALLDEATKPASPAGIRLIRATEANARTLASQLTARHLTTISLFSPRAAILLKLLAIPLTAVGAAGAMLGVPALFFAWLQQWEKVDSAAFLAQRRLLPAAVLIAAYLCGYAARLAVASRYEVRHDEPQSLAMIHSIATAGLGWLAMIWAVETPGVVAGWGVALGCFGWLMAACFISGVSRAKGDFLRDVR